jgi:hypothetical protein
MKSAAQEMLLEAGVEILFHAWGAAPVVRDGAVRGAVFESKGGRRAVLAPVVVDATATATCSTAPARPAPTTSTSATSTTASTRPGCSAAWTCRPT